MKIFEKELENWIVNIGVAGKLPPKKIVFIILL